eukprot:jgi/Psemu1/37408/gm1.37408_g
MQQRCWPEPTWVPAIILQAPRQPLAKLLVGVQTEGSNAKRLATLSSTSPRQAPPYTAPHAPPHPHHRQPRPHHIAINNIWHNIHFSQQLGAAIQTPGTDRHIARQPTALPTDDHILPPANADCYPAADSLISDSHVATHLHQQQTPNTNNDHNIGFFC